MPVNNLISHNIKRAYRKASMSTCKYSGELCSISRRGLTRPCSCRLSNMPSAIKAVIPAIVMIHLNLKKHTTLTLSIRWALGQASIVCSESANLVTYLVDRNFIHIGVLDRFNEVRFMLCEIFEFHETPFALYEINYCLRHSALVESIFPVRRYFSKCLRQVRKLDDFSR